MTTEDSAALFSAKNTKLESNNAPSQIHASLPENLEISSFAKSNAERTYEDVKSAVKILKEVPFFSAMQRDDVEMDQLLTQTFDLMKYKLFKQGDIIFQHRDKPADFYVILKGNVDVYVPKTIEEINEDIQNAKNLPGRQRFSLQRDIGHMIEMLREMKNPRKSHMPSSTMPPAEGNTLKIKFMKASNLLKSFKTSNTGMKFDTINSLLNIPHCFQVHEDQMVCKYKKARLLGPGSHFGELALLKDCGRSATVVAATELHVATLSRRDFKIMSRNFNQSFEAKVDFFAKLIEKEPENSNVARFCYGFKERRYAYGQKIYTQGEVPTEVFVVKHGEVQLMVQENAEKFSSSGLPLIPRSKKHQVEKIAIIGPFSFVGLGETLEDNKYEMTATVNLNGTVLYVIPLNEFKNLRSSFPEVFENFSKKHKTQMNYFESRTGDITLTKKKLSEQIFIPLDSDRKPQTPMIDISRVHSPRFFENRFDNAYSPRVQMGSHSAKNATNKLTRKEDFILPPQSLFTEYKQNTSRDSSRTRGTTLFAQEFNLEKTVQRLTDQARIKRSSSRDVSVGPRPRMVFKKTSICIRNGSFNLCFK